MSLDVLCLGLIVADHVCAPLRRFPPPGGLEMTERLELTIGGCAANVAVDLAKLGIRVGIGGRVGDDVLGRFVVDRLREQHVDCTAVSVSVTAQTAATLVVNVAHEDRRFLHAAGANVEFTGREIPKSLLTSSKIVYVGGIGLNPALSGAEVSRMFRQVRASGHTTALDVVIGDPVELPAMLQEVLPHTDLFLPNNDEAEAITGLKTPREQARRFREWGARAVVITQGANGALLSVGDDWLEAAAVPVTCVDGTGGGDAFVAGYLHGLLQGADPASCLMYGTAMGASCVRSMGATTGVYNREQLEAAVRALAVR
ncbi:MAG: sugar kinase [Planctomycetaceae bacterium]